MTNEAKPHGPHICVGGRKKEMKPQVKILNHCCTPETNIVDHLYLNLKKKSLLTDLKVICYYEKERLGHACT